MVQELLYRPKNEQIMKKMRFFAIFALAASLVLMACDMYDDGIPPKSARNEFKAMYPDAKDIEWEKEGAYWSVSFETGSAMNRTDHEALFDNSGKWIMTETDILLRDVPQAVKDAIAASPEYGSMSYRDNDAEKYETPSGIFYRIELSDAGAEVKVDVTPDGTVTPARYDRF